MNRRLIGALITVLVLLSWIWGENYRPQVKAQGDPSSEIFRLINEFRATQGLPPFQYSNILASAAQSHANWMAANVISHTGAGGSSPLSRAATAGFNGYVVENIVGGWKMSPRQGLIWWQNSPIHLNTLVTMSYPEAGVGYASDGTQNMYVLVVGRHSNSPAPNRSSTGEENSAAPLIITPIELAEPREDGAIVHIMQQGQALWTVAAYYDVDLDFLYLINNLTKKDILHPGNEVFVRLPAGQDPPPTPTPPLSVIVQEGESAWLIAGRHGISVDYLFLLNNLNPSSMLQPGDELVVRLAEGQEPPPTPTPPTTHQVQEGDSAWSIAARYGLTLNQLSELNNLTSDSILRPGDQLVVRFPTPTPLPSPETTSTPAILDLEIADAPEQPTQQPTVVAIKEGEFAGEKGPTPPVVPAEESSDTGLTPNVRFMLFIGGLVALVTGAILYFKRRLNQF
jgi:LysM repeat protein